MQQGKRNYGVDLLRIISMLMILVLHLMDQGGVLKLFSTDSDQYKVGWFVKAASYCAVNCYALISGYVGINVKFRYTNILRLWLQVMFYSSGLTILLYFILPDKVTSEHIIKALFPVTNNKYWYYTAYFGMSFFIPVLNHIVNTMPEKMLRTMVCSIFVLFSLYPTLLIIDPFNIEHGFCALWLALLYLIGGYLRKYPLSEKMTPVFCFAIYFVLVTFSWGNKLYTNTLPEGSQTINFIRYTSPTILLAAIMLLVGFSRCQFIKTKKLIAFFSRHTFSVYLIHAQGLVYSNFMYKKYGFLSTYSTVDMLLVVLGSVLLWFLGCSFIDYLRQKLWEMLRIDKYCEHLVNSAKKGMERFR